MVAGTSFSKDLASYSAAQIGHGFELVHLVAAGHLHLHALFFFFLIFYLFIWLHRVLVAAGGFLCCGMQTLSCGMHVGS